MVRLFSDADGAVAVLNRFALYVGFPLLILVVFYLFLIRPQQSREKKRRQMIDQTVAGISFVHFLDFSSAS